MAFLDTASTHLIVTSPPYFNLKKYASDGHEQLGNCCDYEAFLAELDKVWAECTRVLVPGGRICCVVGAVNIARRKNHGRHFVLPLPADIQVRSRRTGLENLTPIIWHKVSNIATEASKSSRYLGKPNLPNGIVKNDFETILMLRKPGYRQPTPQMEAASRIGTDDYVTWFTPIWRDISGASGRSHPAPFPVEVAYRLIRMFSFAGDTVLDPFIGSGSTTKAAILAGRNSIGLDIEPGYIKQARASLKDLPFGVTLSD